jgi:hypothetical protein
MSAQKDKHNTTAVQIQIKTLNGQIRKMFQEK